MSNPINTTNAKDRPNNPFVIPARAITEEQKREVIQRLQVLWLSFPSLRLGQLIGNAIHGQELYATEDFDMIAKLERVYRKV